MTCIGCDTTETLAMEPAKLFRFLNKFMKYVCPCCSDCGVVSPERPKGIVEGNKFDPSIAAIATGSTAAKSDVFICTYGVLRRYRCQ